MFENLDKFLNKLSDTDWVWWPVLRWRPAPKSNFTTLLVLKILASAVPVGAVGLALLVLMVEKQPEWLSYWLGLSVASLSFFLVLEFMFAPAWNRRAEKLRKEKRRK